MGNDAIVLDNNIVSLDGQRLALADEAEYVGASFQVLSSGGGYRPDSTVEYAYDANGNRLSTTFSIDGSVDHTVINTYDAVNRVSSKQQVGDNINDKQVDYTYTPDHQLSTIHRYDIENTPTLVGTSNYTYDDLARLTNLTHSTPA